ncbi:MAG TPA: hypothetical protein VEL06_13270, partial [Haliangiales bacterium]|nr:hypothetical protein [Haliangiales bacterium]
RLLEQAVTFARHLARDNAGNNNEARIAMIAMTTSNSIRVKANSRPLRLRGGRPNNTSSILFIGSIRQNPSPEPSRSRPHHGPGISGNRPAKMNGSGAARHEFSLILV